MSTDAPAGIGSVPNIPPRVARKTLPFANVRIDHKSSSPFSSAEFPQVRSDGYQVALLSIGNNGAIPDGTPHSAYVPYLLLLPLTWDDLLTHFRSESTHTQLKGSPDVAQFGEIWIDFLRYEARRSDQPVELTAIEFKILKFFTSNPYRVISRGELLDKVWGYDCYPSTRTVDNRILSLRQKLEPEPANPIHFQTIHGAGYKFVPC
jgi:hypothetical protein